MSSVFMYVVDRDFGFAPNPFHGTCTLATCKPRIRRAAAINDWIVGMGGRRLRATGRCVFAMRVDRKLSFNEYWEAAEFRDKRPIRNGSLVMLVGDNVYHKKGDKWLQADCHHSQPNGTPDPSNIKTDTSADAVLISDRFFYFGNSAPQVPQGLLDKLGFRNGRNHRRLELPTPGEELISWIESSFTPNRVIGDPHDLSAGASRYSAETNKITT